MKTTKKLLAITLALVFVFCVSVTAFAAKPTTGSITVKNTTTGKTYKAFKIFDATVSEDGDISYTYSGDLTGNDYFEKDSAGNVTAKEAALDADGELNANAIKALAKLKGASADATKTGNGSSIVFEGLAFGYYYIESSLGTAVTVTSTTPTATIIDKNITRPGKSGDKDYKSVVVEGAAMNKTTASIGDKINFQIAFKALNFDTYADEDSGKPVTKQIVEYVVEDIPTGITIDWSTLKVSVGGSEISQNFNLNKAKNTITLAWANSSTKAPLYDSPVDVLITYSAEVVKAGDSSNDVEISYKYDDGDTDTPKPGNPDEPSVEIKNYSITIYNVESDGTTPLDGAKFQLLDSQGNPINLVKESDGVYRVATQEEVAAEKFKSAVIEAGTAEIKGLKNGSYSVEQLVAPDGYNKLTETLPVVIEDEDEEVTVQNNKGTVLPVTGSSATLILVMIGAFVMLAAGAVLVTNKRMSKESF